jgi:hypothetical protein
MKLIIIMTIAATFIFCGCATAGPAEDFQGSKAQAAVPAPTKEPEQWTAKTPLEKIAFYEFKIAHERAAATDEFKRYQAAIKEFETAKKAYFATTEYENFMATKNALEKLVKAKKKGGQK